MTVVPRDDNQVSIPNLYFEVAKGSIAGHSVEIVTGRNTDLDSTGAETLWGQGGLYVAPTVARLHDIVSSSTADASAGTGARTISIEGLDTNYDEISETITMNGTTNVPTTKLYLRINQMSVLTAGSGDENAGAITATAQTDSTVTAHMEAAHNLTQQAVYTVPNNKTAYVFKGWASIAKNGASNPHVDIEFKVGTFGGIEQVSFIFGLQGEGTSNVQHLLPIPLKISEKTDMRLGGDSSVNNTSIAGGWDMIIVND